MSTINWDSIKHKASDYMSTPKMKRVMRKRLDEYMLGRITLSTSGVGSAGAPLPLPYFAADKFIEVLKNEIASHAVSEGGGSFSDGNLGQTAISALSKLDHGEATSIGDGKYIIDIWFTEDLHRDSLVPDKYDGVDNIAALLNSGYSAGHTVYGYWTDHGDRRRASLPERAGTHFIENAIRNFMGNYAAEYGVVDIEVDDIYK